MFIYKKPPRPHLKGEPLLHENHRRPVTRRDFIAAGMLSGPAMVIGPAWLGAVLRANRANAALDPDIANLLANTQCNVPTNSAGIPFICFDLAGGANLVGSEVLVGQQGGQTAFLSTAGYELLGVPGNMVPSSSANIDPSLGLLWHADGAIKRGILSKATTPATAAGTSGGVFCAESQNDTQANPHNPMYGIAMAGAQGQLLTLWAPAWRPYARHGRWSDNRGGERRMSRRRRPRAGGPGHANWKDHARQVRHDDG